MLRLEKAKDFDKELVRNRNEGHFANDEEAVLGFDEINKVVYKIKGAERVLYYFDEQEIRTAQNNSSQS